MSIEVCEREVLRALERFVQRYVVWMEREVHAKHLGVGEEVLRVMEELGLVERAGPDVYRLRRPSLAARVLARRGRARELFPLVEGYDDIKEFIAKSFLVRGVNVLLVGPPASGKTLFLETIYVLNQDIAVHVDAANTTSAGFVGLVVERGPEIVCIDELDKAYDRRLYASLSLMLESGKVIETKHGKVRARAVRANVYAAANTAARLPSYLRDRFLKFRLRPYAPDEIVKISARALTKFGIVTDGELATRLAETMVREVGVRSIRDILKLGRFVRRPEDIDFVKRIASRYMAGRLSF